VVNDQGTACACSCHTAPVPATITVRRPHVLYGPAGIPEATADADYLREAARNIRHSRCLGSNVTNTVEQLLLDAADALTTPGASS
jgi:hypothetical protein